MNKNYYDLGHILLRYLSGTLTHKKHTSEASLLDI